MGAVFDTVRLETERLVLRPPRPSDALAISSLLNNADVSRMLTRAPYPYGPGDAEAFLNAYSASDPTYEQLFVVEHRAHGLAGMLGFHAQSAAASRTGCVLNPELGFWLGRAFWGRGLGTEAVTAAVHWAESGWNIRAMAAGHFAENQASARVLDKAGFLYTGEVQDRFSLARGETARTRMMVRLA